MYTPHLVLVSEFGDLGFSYTVGETVYVSHREERLVGYHREFIYKRFFLDLDIVWNNELDTYYTLRKTNNQDPGVTTYRIYYLQYRIHCWYPTR